MPVGDIFRIEIQHQLGSSPVMNVMHARIEISGPDAQQETEDVIEKAAEWWRDEMAPNLSENWQIISVYARRIEPTPGVPSIQVLSGASEIVGGVIGEFVPPQCALLISLYTASAAPTGRGRIYVPGFPEEFEDDGRLTNAAYTLMQAAADELEGAKTGSNGTELRFGVYSRSGGGTFLQVQQAVARTNLTTIRGRRNFPGFAA